jgi:hypothetical protein
MIYTAFVWRKNGHCAACEKFNYVFLLNRYIKYGLRAVVVLALYGV